MLNWDEYGKEENTTPPVAPEIKTEAVTQEVAAQQSQPPQPAENLSLIHISEPTRTY